MSLLCDREIAEEVRNGTIGISLYNDSHLNPASYDLTLAADIRVPRFPGTHTPLDVRKIEPDYTKLVTIDSQEGRLLEPGDFLLATSEEVVRIPRNVAARAEGKSSLGRIGLMVHVTAGYIDPGFDGQVTLEIFNCLPRPIILRAGMRIAQLAFFRMSKVPATPYGSGGVGHYQNQRGPTESRYSMEP